MAPHNAGSDGRPVPGTSVAARTMDIFPIPARRAFAQLCKKFSNASLPEIGKILRRVRSDGCPTSGASVAAHIEVLLKKRLERIAGALAEASDKSEFSCSGTDILFLNPL
ncbi:MAG: hypothetical protein IKQ55_06620 [Kiritimatiellae bacterium]|nr:hypothetical protein [Kiritimatiellia bacterium]